MSVRILVVGAGPVGLIVAAELAKYGIDVDIIDREHTSTTRSKALSVSAASLKAFHGLGLSGTFLERGKLIEDVYIYYDGQRCAHINNRYLDTCYRGYLSISQPETEQILTWHLAESGVDIRRGIELAMLSNQPDHVDVLLRDLDSARVESRRYDYVVGCDGAQSTVRRLLDISFDGMDYDMHFIMGDVRFREEQHFDATSYHVERDSFLIFLPMARGLTRLVIKKSGPLTPDRPSPQIGELQASLTRFHPETLTIDSVEWASSARFFSRIAPSNAIGRVFLAGDAYHLFSPIGGQGMNTGIQDALNLAWKLALYATGRAKRRLVDSYTDERYLVVRKVLASTHRHTEIISRTGRHPAHEQPFHASMTNRSLYRSHLPAEFSGLAADHSTTPSLVGRHVPYFALKGSELNISDSYEIPKLKRSVGFVKDSSALDDDAMLRAKRFGIALSTAPRDASTRLGLADDDVCVIRPDGYVGYQGPLSHLPAHLEDLYH